MTTGATLHPVAVPTSIRELVLDEPLDQAAHVGAQPGAVGKRVRVDAAVDFATPVRQVVVLPAAVHGQLLRRPRQDGRIDPPFPQRVQRPGGGGVGLTLAVIGMIHRARIRPRGEVRPAGPLAVPILQLQQPGTHPLRRDPRPGRRPHHITLLRQITLHLPAQRRVGVEQPSQQCLVKSHA